MIIYPVDPDSRWAAWRISTAKIIKHNKPWPRHDGGEIVDLDPDLVPLLEVQATKPAFDSALQRLTRSDPVVDVAANTHTHGWTVVQIPQEELDDIAEREQAKAVYQDLKDGTGTQLQRLVRTEKVCAYLLKDLFGAGQ
jgi:hypothetical protein